VSILTRKSPVRAEPLGRRFTRRENFRAASWQALAAYQQDFDIARNLGCCEANHVGEQDGNQPTFSFQVTPALNFRAP
jgi:hypothetical protein